MKPIFLKCYSVIMAACLLSGCLSSVKLTPQTNYMLNAMPDVASYRTRPLTLLVLTPETESAYDTMQMAYALHSYQIAYYDKNRWAETPGQMLQALMVRTLQNTHYFRAVLTPPTVGRYQYVLMTRILQLKHDYTHLPVMARLTVRAQLVRVATNQVVATQEFTMSQPMRQHTPFGGVVAANRATADFLIALTQFCVQQAR